MSRTDSTMSKINWKRRPEPLTLLRVGTGLPWQERVGSQLSTTHVDGGWGGDVFWPPGTRWRGVIWILVIFFAYLGTVLLYPFLASGGVALLWLPNAVLVTALLRFRPRDWRYVYAVGLLAEVVGDLTFKCSIAQGLYFGVVNAIEATVFLLCAALIAGGRRNIGLLSVRGALAVILASVTVPALTGGLGAIGSFWAFDADYFTAWQSWWFGDGMGLLVGVPVGLLLRDTIRSVARHRAGPVFLGCGAAAASLSVLSAGLAITGNPWGAQQTAIGTAVILSLAFGAVGAPTAAVFITIVTLIGLAQQHDLASVTRTQTLLFVVLAAIYAIAAAMERADQAMGESRILARQLQQQTDRMKAGLDSAATYMSSIMPRGLQGPVTVSSRYLPSQALGGDSFDYTWIDDDHLFIYMLDVSGHGLEPALLAVSVHNLLRSGSLAPQTLQAPEAVLTELNRLFQMDQQGNHYLTMWCGTYEMSTRTLRYASAGAPPAFAFTSATGQADAVTELSTKAAPVGMFADTVFTSRRFAVPPGCRVLVCSDGASEIALADHQQLSWAAFTNLSTRLARSPHWSLDELIDELRALTPTGVFEDDCSLIQLTFD